MKQKAEMSNISVAGRRIEISPLPESSLRGLTFGEKLSFDFYDGEYRDVKMIFLKPKGKNPSPKNCAITASRMEGLFGIPVVYILNPGPTFERQRLFDKNVYFVMSDKYANLPMTIALERSSSRKEAVRLTPVAQYLLLYHLQIKSIEGLTVSEISKLMPYSYESVSIGITCLCDLGLCEKERQGTKSKVVKFKYQKEELWSKASEYTINPIEKRIFCDGLHTEKRFPICGINALSHYSMLNPDKEQWIAMTSIEYRSLIKTDSIENPNEYDGETIIEVWKYPPVMAKGESTEYVDKLSLSLTLKDDEDPRVENEVERMINEIQW